MQLVLIASSVIPLPNEASASAVFQWDWPNWQPVLKGWESIIPDMKEKTVLEVGANKGGLSLWFALQGAKVCCTDLHLNITEITASHAAFQVQEPIRYQVEDTMNLSFPKETFDIVCFRSVLGVFSYPEQVTMIQELHRVLKPGGYLLFAENLKGSQWHQWGRRQFRSWGNKWNYPTIAELESMLYGWKIIALQTHGFMGILPAPGWIKQLLCRLDYLLQWLTRPSQRYIGFGVAQKAPF